MRILIGVLTAWPLVYFILFFVFMFGTVIISGFFGREPLGGLIVLVFVLHMFTILLSFALIAFYIVFLFKTDRVDADKKALWAVVLFLGNMIAMPVFYYLYIWKKPEEETALSR
jgi:hypothetical protein